ncbi:MAG: DUF6298 domain-containing protein [Armatimonadota bacterium]
MSGPIRIHPDNPKIFEYQGRPLMLVTATEHYGSVLNRRFDFACYLADAVDKRMTLTRLFVLFRELQSPINPYSPCKPESPDYIAPFPRTGGGTALDGQPKYDLDQWNPEFFDRLHRFLSLAQDCGIIVEVTLLSNSYEENIWALNPLHADNNINGLPRIPAPEYMSRRHPALFERQLLHVRKIVEETNRYDNIFYEICNEPGGAHPDSPQFPTPDEVDDWQRAIAAAIRETEAGLPKQHLIAGQEAFTWAPWEQTSTRSFRDFPIDIVNMHPLPNTTYDGKGYDMGQFMTKELKLKAVRDFCLATYHEPKPLNYDEDNAASQYREPGGWTVHRKRAWTTLMCGCHYDYIDFSIVVGREAGTPESQAGIRSWMKHLSEFVHTIDLVRARPVQGLLTEQPQHTLESVLAVEGEDYCIYLADAREVTDPGSGDPIDGRLALELPAGEYQVSCYSPVTGMSSPALSVSGDAVSFALPRFTHDLVVRFTRC